VPALATPKAQKLARDCRPSVRVVPASVRFVQLMPWECPSCPPELVVAAERSRDNRGKDIWNEATY
jgi:hypothetical protein